MVGNRSTGIRARLVIPITTRARQITTIRYGLRIEKPGIMFPGIGCFCRLVSFLICHELYYLRSYFFAGFQAATVTDHDLFAAQTNQKSLPLRSQFAARG